MFGKNLTVVLIVFNFMSQNLENKTVPVTALIPVNFVISNFPLMITNFKSIQFLPRLQSINMNRSVTC